MNIKKLGIALLLSIGVLVSANTGSAGATSVTCVYRVFDKGDSGTCVKYIQTLNNVYAPSYANKLTVDGKFGTLTQKSIRKLESNWLLGADGVVRSDTWQLLCTTRAGYIDSQGINHMDIPSNWPLSTAKAAGCSRYWHNTIVAGVRY